MKSIMRFATMLLFLIATATQGVCDTTGDKADNTPDATQSRHPQYIWLLDYTAVQNALELDANQKREIADIEKQIDDAMPNPDSIRELPAHQREVELHAWETKTQKLKAKLGDILNADQLRRLEEITMQLRLKMRAVTLLAEQSLSEKLSLSPRQKKELETIADNIQRQITNTRDALMNAGAEAGEVSEEKAQQFRDECRRLRDEAYEKAMGLLSPQQKDKLAELTGKMVDINIEEMLTEQSARVERWIKRWRGENGIEEKQTAPAAKSDQEHPVSAPAEGLKNR